MLTTVPGVELCKVGVWSASTGRAEITRQDLQDAVHAAADPSFRKAVLKVGHKDARFVGDGAPSLGQVTNLRIAGETLVGDLINVPAGIAKVMPAAWPSRSIEARTDVKGKNGKYSFVLTGLALLGSELPAIESLADVAALYGVELASDEDNGLVMVFSQQETNQSEGQGIMPDAVVMSSEEIEVTDAAAVVAEAVVETPVAEVVETETPAAVVAEVVETPAEVVVETPVALSAETITLSRDVYENLVAEAEAGRVAMAAGVESDRESFLSAQITEGRITAASKDRFMALMQKADEETRATILSFPSNSALPILELGSASSTVTSTPTVGYDVNWLTPSERARLAALQK